MSSPVFIIGTERSGTNLLRLMLNAHRSITVPHPPHIVKLFSPLVRYYGDLGNDRNFRRLIGDVCRMVELHTYPWPIKPDREQIFRQVAERDLINVYFQLYDQYLASVGKRRWVCKSTFMIDHVAEILRYHPAARFIFMVRDGRDVAVSAKTSIFNHFHVYYSACRWQREQRIGLDWMSKLPPGQINLLKYENLISDPETSLRRLCGFLEEEFDPLMLEYHRSDEAQKSGKLSLSWENTSRPLLVDNANKYRHKLSTDEILQFEAIACREMLTLGYVPDNTESRLEEQRGYLLQDRPQYRFAELRLKIKAEVNHLIKDRNSGSRVQKNLYMASIGALRRLTRRYA